MYYQVKNLYNTQAFEDNFDVEYHSKYLNKTGEYLKHNYRTSDFMNFICLIFKRDINGRPSDVDWIHEDDLVSI